MRGSSKGFSPVFIIIILLILAGAGYLGYQYLRISKVSSFDQCVASLGRKLENSDGSCSTLFGKKFLIVTKVDNKYVIEAAINSLLVGALQMYFSENKRYPDTLEQIVPQDLPTMPLNPLTNKPYSYKVSNDKSDFVISATLPDGSEYKVTAPK